MRLFVLTISLLAVFAGAARADDASACGKFKWSIESERTLFASPQPIASGAELAVGAGFRVKLANLSSVAFPAKPERAPKAGTRAATLALRIEAPGAYDITLSDEGWIDLVDHDQRVTSSDFSGAKGCPGVRKSVRFDLKAGDYIVQLSNADGEAMNIAVVQAP